MYGLWFMFVVLVSGYDLWFMDSGLWFMVYGSLFYGL